MKLKYGISAVLLTTTLLGFGGEATFAKNSDRQLTESYQVNWEEIYSIPEENHSDTITFGSAVNKKSDYSTAAWGDLATGSTKISFSASGIKSDGSTKGKVLTTVTSATTSVRNMSTGVIKTGEKGIAIGTLTSSSSVTMSKSSAVTGYSGRSVHTATNSGVLYEAYTSDANVY